MSHGCSKFRKSPYVRLYCDINVGRQKNGLLPIFPYSIIENSPTSFVYNSVCIGPNNFKLGLQYTLSAPRIISRYKTLLKVVSEYSFGSSLLSRKHLKNTTALYTARILCFSLRSLTSFLS